MFHGVNFRRRRKNDDKQGDNEHSEESISVALGLVPNIENPRLLSFAGVYSDPYGAGFTLERSEGLRTGSVEFILSLSKGYSQ